MTPSPTLRAQLRTELARHEPWASLRPATLDALLAHALQAYYAPGEQLAGPQDGPEPRLRWIRRGRVLGQGPLGVFAHEPGESFPAGAVRGARPVAATYRAEADVFCLEFEGALVRRLAQVDSALAGFLDNRLAHLQALTGAATQAAQAAGLLGEQAQQARLETVARRPVCAVAPHTPLGEALGQMQRQGVGSVVVVDEATRPLGILTRHDLLERVVLRQPPPDLAATAVGAVMSAPAHTLELDEPVHAAALLMARLGVRHVPLTRGGQLAGIVSERDLYALQRQSLGAIGDALRAAQDLQALPELAARIRAFVRQLFAQGVEAAALTALVSHLNDLLAQRLFTLQAAQHGLDTARACWVAFGSEARAEQTIATDQDNGLVLADEVDDAELARWRALGRAVNTLLDACGYPLCKGGIMAGEAACCLRQRDWLERFSHWMAAGQPEGLLQASIFFDLRAIGGRLELAQPLLEHVARQAPAHPLFLRLLAGNALRLQPALAWHGGLQTQDEGPHRWVDLKLHGSAVFVDAARLLALATGVQARGTRERLVQAGQARAVAAREHGGWARAFEVLQALRLRAQVRAAAAAAGSTEGAGDAAGPAPNRIDVAALDDVERWLLKEAMRVARRLQHYIELEWLRT